MNRFKNYFNTYVGNLKLFIVNRSFGKILYFIIWDILLYGCTYFMFSSIYTILYKCRAASIKCGLPSLSWHNTSYRW